MAEKTNAGVAVFIADNAAYMCGFGSDGAAALLSACSLKGALYRIQILCRRCTFWSYSAGLTIADPQG